MMKTVSHGAFSIGLLVLWLSTAIAAPPQRPSREKLRVAAENGHVGAEDLLRAINKGLPSLIETCVKELVESGHSDLILPLLDDPSDSLRREVARAVSGQKNKATAEALLNGLPKLSSAVRGGSEASYMRNQAKKAFLEALSRISGVNIDESWTDEEVAAKVRIAIKGLPESDSE